jgi:hypothetical protein
MKMQHSFPRWALAGTIILVIVLALAAWQTNPQQHQMTGDPLQDTIPDKNRNKATREAGDRDLDKEMRQLEKASEDMKSKDWEKMQRDIEESIKRIDIEKIQKQTREAVQRIEFEKVHKQIEESLSRIDFDKIQQQIDESMARASDINNKEIKEQLQKVKQQVKEVMKKEVLEKQNWKEDLQKAHLLNKEQMEKQMSKLREDMDKVRENIKQEKFNFKKEMQKAHVELAKAKEEMKGYQEMIYAMEKEGLLNTNEDYTIEYKDGELYVNDKKQSAETTNRYKKYFKKDKITIKKEDGDMHIQHNSDKHLD